jgi:hypothetical protein
MRILYGKIGRSFNLDRTKMSTLGGDVDVLNLLERLALRYPNDEIIIVGRNTGENPQEVGLPGNVRNFWENEYVTEVKAEIRKTGDPLHVCHEYTKDEFRDADAIVMWLGQHGTSNIPIPNIGTDWPEAKLTNPQTSFLNYVGFLHKGINLWRDAVDGRREEAWLLPDVRNYTKGRDLKWPLRTSVLAQYNKTHQAKFERWDDRRNPEDLGFDATWEYSCWVTQVTQAYAGVELSAIQDPATFPMPSLDGRVPFGMLVNENRQTPKNARIDIMRKWVFKNWPDAPVYGTWTTESLNRLKRDIQALPHGRAIEEMSKWRCTLTTPASGSGWATSKPWEAFLTGTICFFHPAYDDQNHILKDADPVLQRWLRPPDVDSLVKAVDEVNRNDATYEWLARHQREYLERKFLEDQLGNTLHERITAQATVH